MAIAICCGSAAGAQLTVRVTTRRMRFILRGSAAAVRTILRLATRAGAAFACGQAGTPAADIPEVQLRVGVRGQNKADVERFTKEIAPLILTGPPAVTGFAGGRPKVEEIMAYFPALIPKDLIETKVEIVEA